MLKTLKLLAFILALGLCIPERGVIPVQNATVKDWNRLSFWYEPWGKSGVHKGIDIFAKHGTPVISSTSGLVIYSGHIEMGGNVVAVLGPKWRIHYYAHLDSIHIKTLDWAASRKGIGTVGDSGNAAGKTPHLHYSIMSLIPYPWRFSTQPLDWKKMFFINPAETFE
ncbi:MAG: M23 family metallopeptidase [Methylotenera sp.]|nr:M23 family metallopeptidase [Methylotenera sp.]